MTQNVVFLILDSFRKDRVSVYNEEVDFTSNLQNIAESSTVYYNAVSQAPWTLPSTASMFTGKYPWEHQATNQNLYLDYDGETLAERFKRDDFYTKVISPNMLISPSVGTVNGFDDVDNLLGIAGREPFKTISAKATQIFNYIPDSISRKIAMKFDSIFSGKMELCKSKETVQETKQFLKDVEDENFFIFVNLMSAHEPYEIGEPPEEYLEKHKVQDIDKVPDTGREFFELDDSEYSIEEMEKAYDAAVDFTDDLVGEIHQSIKKNNLDEDTVLIVAADHGQAVGKDKVYGHHFTAMDRVTEVPLMIEEPENEKTEANHNLFELRQLYDLIPHLAGIGEEPGEIDEIKGGYEFPDTIRGIIPEELKDSHDRKFRFVKTKSQKIVESIGRSGETDYNIIKYGGKNEDYSDRELKDRVKNIESTSKVREEDDEVDEEVKKRLEDLGYM